MYLALILFCFVWFNIVGGTVNVQQQMNDLNINGTHAKQNVSNVNDFDFRI